jgi:hypothetical protein
VKQPGKKIDMIDSVFCTMMSKKQGVHSDSIITVSISTLCDIKVPTLFSEN